MTRPHPTPLARTLLDAGRRITATLLVLFTLAIATLWIFQERLVFVPPPVPSKQGRNATRVEYAARDGQRLFAFLVTPAGTAAPVKHLVVVFHGNGDLADSWIDWAHRVAANCSWSVLLAEYRGYGGLDGRPTYDGLMLDGRAALDYAETRLGVAASDIAVFGHSLGSGVATQLGTERVVHAVILEAPMTSLDEVGRTNFGVPIGWFVPLISRIHFSPLERAPEIRAPVSVALGTRDDVLPPTMGRRVFAAARNKGELLVVENAGHGNVSDLGGERYWQWFRRAVGPACATSERMQSL